MNNIYSRPETYYPRWITPLLAQASLDHPVVVLTGARQVGKSTLLLNEEPFRNWRFRNLDDLDTLRAAHESPEDLWAGADKVVLDEVQRAPDLLLAVKRAVDRQPGRFRFVLSGSANLLLMKQVGESLAGRAVYFVLDPMTFGEVNRVEMSAIVLRQILEGKWPEESVLPAAPLDPASLILRGLMPPLLQLNSPEAWVRWWGGYVSTYLERDLRQIAQITALLDFRRLMEFAALRSGQLLNQAEIARDARLTQPTVHRYLNLLETTHLFERLPAYTASKTTRLLKSPKAYWADPALPVFLSGYYHEEELRKAREYGGYFENLIYHHLRVFARLMTPPGKLHFWRTQSGQEVDLVLEHGRRLLAVEVKLTAHPGYADATGLRAFTEAHSRAVGGVLLHSGREVHWLGEKILAIPWTMVTG